MTERGNLTASRALGKAVKWTALVLAVAVALVILFIGGLFLYINIEWPKTEEQKYSLEVIQQLDNDASIPSAFSGAIPDEVPEIYEDQLEPEKFSPQGEEIYEEEYIDEEM